MIRICGSKIIIPVKEWKKTSTPAPVKVQYDRELQEFWLYATEKAIEYVNTNYSLNLADDCLVLWNRKVAMAKELYGFQESAIRRSSISTGYGYIFRPGLGKTITAIADVITLENEKELKDGRILVLCPLSVKVTWEKHLKEYGKKSWSWSVITIQERKNSSLRWIVCTYEHMVSHRDELWEFLQGGPSMMICDESTHIKNQKAIRTQTALQLSTAANFRRILTGTFYANDYRDAWSQLYFLDPEIVYGYNFSQFKNYFGIWTGYKNSELIGIKHKDELRMMVESVCSIVKEAEGLPPRIYEVIRFPLSEETREVYNKAKNDLIIKIDEKTNYTAVDLAIMSSKLRQISGGAVYIGDKENGKQWQAIGEDKLNVLDSTLDECSSYQTVIWCEFSHEIQRIRSMLIKKGVTNGVIEGSTNEHGRLDVLSKFDEGKTSVLIIQNTVGAMGINLQAANISIIFSNPRYALIREQMDYRLWRIGQTKSVTIIDLIAQGTLDSYIRYQVLNKVKDNSELLDKRKIMAILEKDVTDD